MRPRNWCISQLVNTGQGLKQSSKTATTEELAQFYSLLAKWLKMVLAFLTHHFFLPIFHLRLLFVMAVPHNL
jgi:hypothetical protein